MFSRLTAYVDSIVARDPAPRSRLEVLLYPGLWAVGWHRVSHRLFNARLFFLARAVQHMSRFLTGFEIHPGAKIGKHLFLEHGFITIGETAVIGDNVTIYPCVTLGGTNPTNGKGGKRHPTLEDNVIVGAGAQILGPITVGQRARIGANAVVTDDVPEGATMVGVKARSTLVKAETWAKDFMPYGTPCKEPCEPSGQRIEDLEARIALLQAQVEELLSERELADGPDAPVTRKRTRS
ncbi:serine O-acetyltransferase EpsC [Novosphingobium sp. JCM 18896]|uniref:serine O-acetyltransferase EpsC n=1 Tax=Novosphingobium sp. JCM 18896 TaxID=2989731 RepID=UPI002222D9F6|nr:serine O-acetyltransferase EpsC [Novosphingobium sp. JCM 18896]MCW1427984.1 serine O-acetyltransferase [Novosphingobium sp. JCM 18896]